MAGVGENMSRLNIGGGKCAVAGWDVLDKTGTKYKLRTKKMSYDIDLAVTKRWPIPDNTYAVVYSGHTLEHIPQESLSHVLAECYRIMEEGGVLRIQVPDARKFWDKAKEGDVEALRELLVAVATPLTNNNLVNYQEAATRLDNTWFIEFCDHYCKLGCGVKSPSAGAHRNWFDWEKLRKSLANAGFVSIRRAKQGDSKLADMRKHPFDRLIPQMSLYAECRKP